ncbi:Copper Transporter integral membrane protein that functions in high affinity copper transport [Sporothrix epigloea]|uniref:Copper transport protein n=1 Tax=Sporothrix epigloea TaxID=1892477 RepID=A0ABP0DTQ1_9PEZI
MDMSTTPATPTATGMAGMGSMPMTMSSAAPAATSMAGMDMHDGMGDCKISMLWNWNTVDSCFISETWHITSRGMFAGSCIGVVLLVMSLEVLRRSVKEYDRYLVRQHRKKLQNKADDSLATGFHPSVFQQAVRALLHLLQFAVAYFVMLLAMYYNGYIIICICIGAYLGSFIFHWERMGE